MENVGSVEKPEVPDHFVSKLPIQAVGRIQFGPTSNG